MLRIFYLHLIGSDFASLANQSNFMNLFVELLKVKDFAVDQSKFALIGDMARLIPDKLYLLSNDIFPLLINGTNSMCQYIGIILFILFLIIN